MRLHFNMKFHCYFPCDPLLTAIVFIALFLLLLVLLLFHHYASFTTTMLLVAAGLCFPPSFNTPQPETCLNTTSPVRPTDLFSYPLFVA